MSLKLNGIAQKEELARRGGVDDELEGGGGL